jgi:class 3 adenylate cyclase
MSAPQLREAFASESSRTNKTVLFVDQTGSTAMKESQSEAFWLPTLGWFYDTATSISVQNQDDEVWIKYLGDGIMLVWSADRATEAVNAAIRIQEAIQEASAHRDGSRGTVDFSCSIGIATGQVVGFIIPTGSQDFVGNVVDKARRLCDAASPKAIFIDRATEAAANMMRIKSKLGEAMSRTADQYQGDVQRAPLKGFSQPVDYYEILWGQQLYGLKSEAVTDSTDRFRQAQRNTTTASQPREVGRDLGTTLRDDRRVGEVKSWPDGKNFCFLRDTRNGEEFFCPKESIVYEGDEARLRIAGTKVTFAAKNSGGPSQKHRKAVCVLVVGEYADGCVQSKPPSREYAWVRCTDDGGNWQTVFLPQRAGDRPWNVGDAINFKVGANDHGAIAEDVTRADDEAA